MRGELSQLSALNAAIELALARAVQLDIPEECVVIASQIALEQNANKLCNDSHFDGTSKPKK